MMNICPWIVRLGCFYGATCILVLQGVFYYQAQTVLNSHQ